jgi:hypothetical protein
LYYKDISTKNSIRCLFLFREATKRNNDGSNLLAHHGTSLIEIFSQQQRACASSSTAVIGRSMHDPSSSPACNLSKDERLVRKWAAKQVGAEQGGKFGGC